MRQIMLHFQQLYGQLKQGYKELIMPFNIKSSGSYYAIFDDRLLQTENRTYTLPNTGGILLTSTVTGSFPFSSSYALTASYAISAATYQVDIYDSTSAQSTWTKPSWAKAITVIAIGGGGGGGGGFSGNNSNFKSGGGGGGGAEIVWNTYRASDLPNSAISLQIGAAGAGATLAGEDGNDGGSSIFGSNSETTYTVLIARGGYGGLKGVSFNTNRDAIENMTRPVPGRPSTANSTGGGGGGAGTVNATQWGNLFHYDAPSLPYTANDCYLQSHRVYSVNNLSLTGIPASVATTGGGGGTGGDTTNQGLTPISGSGGTAVNINRGGLGGSILSVNQNSGSRTFTGAQQVFKSTGIVSSSISGSTGVNNTSVLQKFINYVNVGMGGRGGWYWFGTYNPPSTGSRYGGGGGGGGWNQNGAAGGSGAIIIISEA